jgi:CcmD family protein
VNKVRYVFWAHLSIWILVSVYIFFLQRKLAFAESRLKQVEEKLKAKEGL